MSKPSAKATGWKGLVRKAGRAVAVGLTALCLAGGAASSASPIVPGHAEAWRRLAEGEAGAAAADFARAGDREARTGRAAALLAAQPRKAATLEEARALLKGVVEEPIQDDWSVMAEYLLARWHQVHAIEPDAAEGERRLLALLERHAGHPWADTAAPKLAAVWLAAEVDAAESARREAQIMMLLERVRDPEARRDTRLVVADAALRHGADHARALPYFRALAEEAEALRPSLRARVLFQVAESAAALGHREEAAEGWRRFAREFPTDARVAEARRRAEEILSK